MISPMKNADKESAKTCEKFNDLDLKSFLENTPPYDKRLLSREGLFSLLKWNEKQVKTEAFCSHCNKERTFTSYVIHLFELSRWLTIEDPHKNSQFNDFISLPTTCDFCKNKHYFALRMTESFIEKVGQFPSFAMSETKRFHKYKGLKEIEKYYTELTQSLNAYSQNMGVAALAYLRRIFEHLINKKYIALGNNCEGIRFEDRLREVEKHERVVPEELEAQKHIIYVVLSKGVHEYEEKECKELYPILLLIIEMILDDELSKKEKKKKLEEAAKALVKKVGGK